MVQNTNLPQSPYFVLSNTKQSLSYLTLYVNKMGAKLLRPMYFLHLAIIFSQSNC